MENNFKMNTFSSDQKKKLQTRTKTSILVVTVSFAILFFGMLSSYDNPWFKYSSEKYTQEGISTMFALVLAFILLGIAYQCLVEYMNCCFKNSIKFFRTYSKILYFLSIVIGFVFCLAMLNDPKPFSDYGYVFLGVGIVPIVVLAVLWYIALFNEHGSKFNKITAPLMAIVLPMTFFAIYYILIFKFFTTFLFLLLITWCADSFAYLGGSFFGKHKLAPKISPNKTIEGFLISLVLTLCLLLAIAGIFSLNPNIQGDLLGSHEFSENSNMKINNIGWWLSLSAILIVLILADTLGDLSFSVIKRKNNIKDFSQFLPGHGGVLDRIDALIFIVCIYTLICFVWSIDSDHTIYLFFTGSQW